MNYVALSFVRTAEDVRAAKAIIARAGKDIPVIAKLEKPEAIENLDEILSVADGVMVARGDLGVEMSLEKVPVVQKQIISRARDALVPVITATQMLDSMQKNPRPTRAEASDVANAIFDGTDALMLSGETAAGNYPLESVAMMDRIICEAEASITNSAAARAFCRNAHRRGHRGSNLPRRRRTAYEGGGRVHGNRIFRPAGFEIQAARAYRGVFAESRNAAPHESFLGRVAAEHFRCFSQSTNLPNSRKNGCGKKAW